MPKIKVILSSSRPARFAEQPGNWIMEISRQFKDAEFELIDLAEVALPFLDEPVPAIHNAYQNEHTKQWSKIINEADGFVFVTAEYNHGYTAVLKNAIDYLYHEWSHKPVAFVSYGADAGGARAVDQLRAVAGHLSMYDITEHVIMPQYYLNTDKDGKFQFNDRHERAATNMLTRLVFWADKMKAIRAEVPVISE
jgi:NAD(P)H-dependent FMN reductase